MKKRFLLLLLIILLPVFSSCSTTKTTKNWNQGDVVICPHCGREHILPGKLGK